MKLKISNERSTLFVDTDYIEVVRGANTVIAKSPLHLKETFKNANVVLDGDQLGKFEEVKFA